jgi:hypothetical protein
LNLGNNVTTIGQYAFSDCTGFTGNLTFPHSLISIGLNSFISNNNITSLTFSNSNANIQAIFNGRYSQNNLKQIIFKDFDALPTLFSTGVFSMIGGNGTLVTNGGSISNVDALNFAKTKSLPST